VPRDLHKTPVVVLVDFMVAFAKAASSSPTTSILYSDTARTDLPLWHSLPMGSSFIAMAFPSRSRSRNSCLFDAQCKPKTILAGQTIAEEILWVWLRSTVTRTHSRYLHVTRFPFESEGRSTSRSRSMAFQSRVGTCSARCEICCKYGRGKDSRFQAFLQSVALSCRI